MLASIFGNLTSGIIRLAITAATLFLIYHFILKPILDTTEKVTSGSDNVERILDSVNTAFQGSGATQQIRRQMQLQIEGADPDDGQTKRLLRCVKRNAGDVTAMQRCAKRFAP